MSTKEDILSRYKRNMSVKEEYAMPDFDALKGVEYADPVSQFTSMSKSVGGNVVELQAGGDINKLIKEAYPEAKVFASNVPGITIAQRNPDTVASAQELNGTDVGIVQGYVGVAENGCIWVPQTMNDRLRVRLFHLRPVQNGRHRAGSCHGSAGRTRSDRCPDRLT